MTLLAVVVGVAFAGCVVVVLARRMVRRSLTVAAAWLLVRGVWWAASSAVLLVVAAVLAVVAVVRHRRASPSARRNALAAIRAERDARRIVGAHKLDPARVVDAHATPAGRRIVVELAAGDTADKLKADVVASATGSTAATVRVGESPRVAIVELRTGGDVLEQVVAPARMPKSPVPVDYVTLGRREDGEPWRVKLRGSHLLVAGVTGSGKGSIIWSIARAVAPDVRTGRVELWGVDPKGGMELGLGRDLFARYADGDDAEMLDLLEQAVAAMDARTRRLAGTARLHDPSVDEPLVVVIVDELATLTAYHPDGKYRAAVMRALGLLCTKGRAPGFVVVACLQDPRKDVVPIRALFPTRVALRLDESRQVDMVLGDGMRERGAACERIPAELPGIGYAREGDGRPVRVRSAYLDDAAVRGLARTYARAHAGAPARRNGEAVSPARAPAHARGDDAASAADATPRRRRTRAERSAENRARHRDRAAS